MYSHAPKMIVSGAQTGADRGGLIAAAILGYEHGGWVPKGRRAEDGKVPASYPVTETATGDFPTRTKLNIDCSDATLLFSYQDRLSGGSALTLKLARQLKKPVMHVVLERDAEIASNRKVAREIKKWLTERQPGVLNVAGPRETKARGIQNQVAEVMLLVLQAPTSCICGRAIPEEVWERENVKEADIGLRCSTCSHTSYWSDFSWTSLTNAESTVEGVAAGVKSD